MLGESVAALVSLLTALSTIFGISDLIGNFFTESDQEKKINEIHQVMLRELTGKEFTQKEIESKTNRNHTDTQESNLVLKKSQRLNEELDSVKELIKIDRDDGRIIIIDEDKFMDQGKFILNLIGRLYAYELDIIKSKEAGLKEIADEIGSYKHRLEPCTHVHSNILKKNSGLENKYSIKPEKISEAIGKALEYRHQQQVT